MARATKARPKKKGKGKGKGKGSGIGLYDLHKQLGGLYRQSDFNGTYGEWLKNIGYRAGRPRGSRR